MEPRGGGERLGAGGEDPGGDGRRRVIRELLDVRGLQQREGWVRRGGQPQEVDALLPRERTSMTRSGVSSRCDVVQECVRTMGEFRFVSSSRYGAVASSPEVESSFSAVLLVNQINHKFFSFL